MNDLESNERVYFSLRERKQKKKKFGKQQTNLPQKGKYCQTIFLK